MEELAMTSTKKGPESGRGEETGALVYDIFEPNEQWVNARVKRAPWYDHEMNVLGAYDQREGGGFRRPVWYGVNEWLEAEYGHRLPTPMHPWDYRWWSQCDEDWNEIRSGRIAWFEHLKMRETGAVIGLGHFAIFEIRGPRALPVLEYLAMNKVDRPVGSIIYTQFLSDKGTIVSDLTITRLGEEHFRIVIGGGDGAHDKHWIIDHLGCDKNGHRAFTVEVREEGMYASCKGVQFFDKSDEIFTVGLWSPHARAILADITDADISEEGFPYMTGKPAWVKGAPVYMRHMSYVLEPGCEFDVSASYALHLWETLLDDDLRAKHGHIPAGIEVYAASAPLEGYYLLQGAEIDEEYNPAEASLLRPTMKRDNFKGKVANIRHRKERDEGNLAAKLSTLTADMAVLVDSSGVTRFPYGSGFPIVDLETGKTIVDRHGRRSYVRRCAYGPSVGLFIARGYLPPEYWNLGTQVGVQYMDEVYSFRVASNDSTSLLDPSGERVKRWR